MIRNSTADQRPETEANNSARPKPGRARLILTALLAAGALLSATAALKFSDLGGPWRLLVALLPVPAYLYFIFAQIQTVRGMDELQQRVELEALVFAFPSAFVGILTTWLLWVGGFLPWLTFSDSVAFFLVLMIGLHVLGRVLAARRYR